MTMLPRGANPGIHVTCTAANTDYPIEIPEGATGCVIAFVQSASDNTMIFGRVNFTGTDAAITPTNTNLAHHFPMPISYTFRPPSGEFVEDDGEKVWTETPRDAYLHVACATAGAVVKGFWFTSGDGV